ncbi:MAG: aminodeoxychorismate/anthranilate synthase component II [Acidobacteriota bacterium]|nr:aminodeoxychorismate/anthranilate synthase component II [Acidobacteriota bacterium]
MVLVIDNYDSFTYNLVQYLGELGARIVVRRNDEMSVDALRALEPSRVLISPGPGRPEQAGVTLDVITTFGRQMPVLGVCLGHQAIGLAFGGQVVRAPVPIHGKTSTVEHNSAGVFAGISTAFQAGRYHSLVVAEAALPADLEVTARSKEDGLVMGLRHRTLPIHGVQFHPESVLTNEGRRILRNFLEM